MENMRKLFFLSLALGFFSAHAGSAFTGSKPLMIYFGGYGATAAQMQTWERGCRSSYGAYYEFEGNRYRGRGASERAALDGAQPDIDRYVKMIKDNPDREFIIVGHSSAGSVPAAIARRLPSAAKVKIVDLDGFSTGCNQQDRFPTVGVSTDRGGGRCRNVWQPRWPNCPATWCGHFRILNRNASASTSISSGYSNFQCNLDWMNRFPSSQRAELPTGDGVLH
jgi:hypothetical protein